MHDFGGTDPLSPLFSLDRQAAGLLQNIKPGQLVSATIVKPTQRGYIVNVAGKNLLLPTTASLEVGQEVQAAFVKREGAWQLRLAHAGARPQPAATATNPNLDQQAAALLTRLGLETTTENSLAAKAFIQAGLAASRGLLENLALLLSGKTTLQTALVHLTELLRNVLPRSKDPDLTAQLRAILAALESTMAAPPEPDLPARLQSLLADSGLLMEKKFTALLQAGAGSNTRPPVGGDLNSTLLRLRSVIDANAQGVRQLLGADLLQDLDRCLSNALGLVRGQQLQNLLHAGMNQLSVQVPFLGAWGLENVRLHFFCEREASSNRSLSYAVAVDISTTNLGRLRAMLRCHRTKLYCHFTVQHEPVAQLLRSQAPLLKERLEACRFSIGAITCSVVANEDSSAYDTSWPLMSTVDVQG